MIRKATWLCFTLLGLCPALRAEFIIADHGRAQCVVIQQTGATEPELHAARELAHTLDQITGGNFEVQTGSAEAPKRAIIVGQGATAAALFPEIDFSKCGPEEFVMRSKGKHLLLAGGRPRGTIYAVNRFLQEQCGARWWTPWASTMPNRPNLRVASLDTRTQPAFEYREPYWFPAFDPEWKVHNCVNGQRSEIPAGLGGCIRYKGFSHTFYPLVPPSKYFEKHPEWYSLVRGKRTHHLAQLCLTNPRLRDFVVERVKERLRAAPGANIISVTQNDCDGHCECPNCKALDDAEGSHSGTMLDFVNYVAEKIEPEFPNVAVDTFAYQYTRKPPKTIKPRRNVIVRLCSIECNFREPLDQVSNASFAEDIRGWSRICPRLYIWDYTTDFSHYIQPHPNWFTLGPNLRFFQDNGVKGVYEQGAYAGQGAEMAELRAWMLAQLLWNPRQDDGALIHEFLEGYYGRGAARPIGEYLELMQGASKGFYLGCFTGKNPPYLRFQPLATAEGLWQKAENAAGKDTDPEKLERVRIAHLPVRYAWLARWESLRRECREDKAVWPLPESRKAVAGEWGSVAQGEPGKEWTVTRILNETRLSTAQFLTNFVTDPVEAKRGAP